MLNGSVRFMRGLAAAGLVSTLILAGCGGGDPAPTPEDPEPTPTANTQASADGEPVDDEPTTEEQTVEEEPTGEEPTTEGTGEGGDVTIEDLGELPETIGDMSRTDSRVNSDQHVAGVDFAADDGITTLRYSAYLPDIRGEFHVLDGTDDELFIEMTEVSREFLEEEGDEIRAFDLDAGSYAWTCFEAMRAAGSDNDHTMCHSVAYGHMIAVEYVTLHDEDQLAREDNLSSHLEELGEALASMP